jgi:tetratricopeptide (TPR) repeat protein
MRPTLICFALALFLHLPSLYAQETVTSEQAAFDAFQRKDYATAIQLYTAVIEQDPENTGAIYNRALSYLATGDDAKAIPDLNITIERQPGDLPARFNRGVAFARTEKFTDALNDFNEAIDRDSTFAAAWFMRGQVRLQQGMVPEAVLDLWRYLELDPASQRAAQVTGLLARIGFPVTGSSVSRFKDDEGKIAISLPAEWHRKASDDGKTLNMFISLQKVEKESDIFLVGATIRRLRRMSKSFENVEQDGAWLAGFWTGMVEQGAKDYHAYTVRSTRDITVGQYVGVLREVDLQMKKEFFPVRMYELILGHDDEVVTVTLESPAPLFPTYQPHFDHAIESLVIER